MKPKKQKAKERRITREERTDSLKEFARSFEFTYNPSIIDLTKNPEECRKATEGACWRPDIYLNNLKGCSKCVLFENCACTIKITKKRH